MQENSLGISGVAGAWLEYDFKKLETYLGGRFDATILQVGGNSAAARYLFG
jgi:hypothetical protein